MKAYTLIELEVLAREYEKDYCNSEVQKVCEEYFDTVREFLDWMSDKEKK